MKFLPREHRTIKAAIEQAGIAYSECTFVKRKGRLFITYKKDGAAFVMHRKSETLLDANNQWVTVLEYTVYQPIQQQFASWEGVLNSFKKWLATLK